MQVKVVNCAHVEELGFISVLYKQANGNVIDNVIEIDVAKNWAKY